MIYIGQGGSRKSRRIWEGPGGSLTVPECMEGPRVYKRFQGGSSIFLGVFYGLKGSGRIQEGQRGSGRVQEGLGVLGGSIIFLDPKLFLAQNIFDQYLYGPKIFGTQMFFWHNI